jgi:hypothetical protein
MNKIAIPWIALLRFCIVLMVPVFALVFPAQASAADPCSSKGITNVQGLGKTYASGSISSLNVSFSQTGLDSALQYQLRVYMNSRMQGESPQRGLAPDMNFTITPYDGRNAFIYDQAIGDNEKYVYVYANNSEYCFLGTYSISANALACNGSVTVSQDRSTGETCQASTTSCTEKNRPVKISINGLQKGSSKSGSVYVTVMRKTFSVGSGPGSNISFQKMDFSGGKLTFNVTPTENDTYEYFLSEMATTDTIITGNCARKDFVIRDKCDDEACSEETIDETEMQPREFKLCTQISNDTLQAKCDACLGKEGVWTAVGCVSRKPQSIVKAFLEIGLGLGGGICLLMCLTGGFMLTTSQGDPKQVGEAREMITSAIVGLLFIIFSVFILQFIGVTILNIPGFGTTVTAP